MNQILFFEENGVGKNMKQNIKFFAVSMMAFGIILIGKGGYAFTQDIKTQTNEVTTIKQAEDLKPEITYEQNNSKLTVIIDGKSEIAKITYKWNEEPEKSLLNITGQKNVEREIDIPAGKNDLTIKLTYKDAPNFPYEQKTSYTSNSAKIDWSVVGKKIKITVEDSKGIDYVLYKWNEQEEVITEANLEDNTKMEVLAEIPFGLNTLKATVVNVFGETSEASLEVKGTEKPLIEAKVAENGMMTIEVTSADNIKNVDFSVNGEEYKLNVADFLEQGYTIEELNNSAGLHLEAGENGNIVKLTYEFQLQLEENEVKISAKTQYATEEVSGIVRGPIQQ